MIDWEAGHGFLNAGGKRLEWGTFGPAPDGKPVIVLLHEGLGCLALWRDFPQKLSEATGLSVFAYSRAGYGQSEASDLPLPLDYMTCEALDVLPEVLDEMGADQFFLMGHSDGATIAAIYAARLQDVRLRGVILMAPHFFAEDMGLAEIERAKVAYETTDLREKMGRYHADPDVAFYGWNGAWLDPGFRAWNVADVIDCINRAILVIQGREDQYGTLAQVEEITRRSQRAVSVAILEECRHAPHFDQTERVLAEVTAFTREYTRGPGERIVDIPVYEL